MNALEDAIDYLESQGYVHSGALSYKQHEGCWSMETYMHRSSKKPDVIVMKWGNDLIKLFVESKPEDPDDYANSALERLRRII